MIIDTPAKFEKLIGFYLLGVFYIGWVAYGYGRNSYGRLEGIGTIDGSDANDTAALIATAVPILIFYLLRGNRWQQFTALVGFAYIINALILINSRGAFLGTVVGCGYMITVCILNDKLSLKVKNSILVGIVLCVCLFLYLTDEIFWDRMGTLNEIGQQVGAGGAGGRTYFWIKTFDLVKKYPLGTGVAGYTYLSPSFLPNYMLTNGVRAVHSTYFQVLAEYGYVGIILFGALIISNFRVLRRIKKNCENLTLYLQAVALESSFICYLIAIMFIDRFYSVILYWLMLMIACLQTVNQAIEHKSYK
jgi:O-antigen ligase